MNDGDEGARREIERMKIENMDKKEKWKEKRNNTDEKENEETER